jgi:hypothetical protein
VSGVTSPWWVDDDELLADLSRALEPVPASFVQAGKMSFTWRSIDAELAALTYDSSRDLVAAADSRAEPAALRCLTFDASQVTIELEIVHDALHGQLVPPAPGAAEIRHADGTVDRVAIDEVGYFTSTPVPAGTFRLYCAPEGGEAVLTDWITL